MTLGVIFAVAACALWALSFVSPIVLEQFSPAVVALGRYAAFGVISLAMIPIASQGLKALTRADWEAAAALSTIGNLVYYLLLASAIQLIDVPAPTVIIGLLPLTIPLFANWKRRELPWRALAMPLLALAFGLLAVNAYEHQRLASERSGFQYGAGLGLAVAALGCWTWYGVLNANWLKTRPHITPTAWTVAQGITILPIVVIGAFSWRWWSFIAEGGWLSADFLDSKAWARFVFVSVLVGLGSSWLATLCWSHASRLLPTTLAGQLIVFETIAAVAYGLLYRARLPSLAIVVGVTLLCLGIALGVRAFQLYRVTSAGSVA